MVERKRHGRKLLIASIGVAAVSYVACGGSTTDSGGGAGSSAGGSTAGGGGKATPAAPVTGNTGGSLITGPVDSSNAGGNSWVSPIDTGSDREPSETLSAIGPMRAPSKTPPSRNPSFGFDVLVANLIAPPPPDAKADTK